MWDRLGDVPEPAPPAKPKVLPPISAESKDVARVMQVRLDTYARKQAEADFREDQALRRMLEKDAAYDEPHDLIDLWDTEPIQPQVCAMTNGACVLYEGHRNGVFGPTESGKTMLAVMAMIQEIRVGRPVVYLDFENGPKPFVDRLRSFGASKDQVMEYVRYFWVTGSLPSPEKAESMAEDLIREGGRLVVIDTVHAAMGELGLDPFRTDDVERFYRLSMDPWAHKGCAPVVLDHTTKSDPFRPYGSERKASGLSGMNVNVVPVTRFSQTIPGWSNVHINKDRHGGGPEYADETRLIGELHIIPAGEGVGAIELRPMDRAAMEARAEEAEAVKEAEAAVARMALRKEIHDWVKKHDEGEGVFASWATKGNAEKGVPRVQANTHTVRRAIQEMLEDAEDPLIKTDSGRVTLGDR